MFKTKILRLSNDDRQFYQWDTERKLIVNDNTCDKVYFSNDGMEMALTCNIYEVDGVRMVNVPNIILQDAKPLKVHLSMVDNDGRLTTYYEAFHVAPRKKPNGYVYTETETFDYEYLDERLKSLEKANVVMNVNGVCPNEEGAVHITAKDIGALSADSEMPMAGVDKFGGIKADNATDDDIQPVRIGEDGRLYTAPSSKQPDWNQDNETASDYIKNKPDITTDDEIIELLIQEDMLPVVSDSDGAFLADDNENILLW